MCALLPTVKGPYKGEEAKFRKFFSARLQTLHFTRTPSSITLYAVLQPRSLFHRNLNMKK